MASETFVINWFDGTNASVTFSSRPNTPFSVPEVPLEDPEALIEYISDWWSEFQAEYPIAPDVASLVNQVIPLS